MTRREMEVFRDGAKAQLSWARRHSADRELLDVLRLHIQLSEEIEQRALADQPVSPPTSRRYAA
jgi:hypothetical protein